MTERAHLVLGLELRRDDDRIAGVITGADQVRRPFAGWLEFIAGIEAELRSGDEGSGSPTRGE